MVTTTPVSGNIQWPATEQQWCDYFKDLDAKFGTDSNSPLHHDNRCTNHGNK